MDDVLLQKGIWFHTGAVSGAFSLVFCVIARSTKLTIYAQMFISGGHSTART